MTIKDLVKVTGKYNAIFTPSVKTTPASHVYLNALDEDYEAIKNREVATIRVTTFADEELEGSELNRAKCGAIARLASHYDCSVDGLRADGMMLVSYR